MKKILFVLEEHQTGPSGVIAVVKEKIDYFYGKKFQIFILCNKTHWCKNEFFNNNKIKLISLHFLLSGEIKCLLNKYPLILKLLSRIFFLLPSFFYNIHVILRLFLIMKNFKIDYIFNHNGGWIGGELNRFILLLNPLLKIKKHIFIIHNYPQQVNLLNFFKIKFYNALLRKTNCEIVTVSNDCKKKLVNFISYNKITFILNGIRNIENLTKTKHRATINLGYFGKIEKRKGLSVLLKALKTRIMPINTYIYGNIKNNNYSKYLTKVSYGIKNKIFFKSFVKNITPILKNIDIVILPSLYQESFGMVLIEAMRSGKAIVCSNSGGMKEILINNYNGFFFKTGDPNSLNAQLQKFIKNRKLIKRHGLNGRRLFLKKFTNEKMCKEYGSFLSA
jgi:teichuronic acid biosynthesis glycosyltransferase TuaC